METQEKYRTVIAVAAIVPPSGRAKSARIDTYEHGPFSIWPDKIGLLRAGELYDVEYSEKLADNGVTYRNIQGTPHHVGPYVAPEPKPRALSAAVPSAKDFAAGGNNGNGYYRPTHPRDAERMFTVSVLNAFIETGRINNDAQTLIDAIQVLRHVWAETFGQDETNSRQLET